MENVFHSFTVKDHHYIFDYHELAIFELGEELFGFVNAHKEDSFEEFVRALQKSSIIYSDQVIELINEGYLFCDTTQWNKELNFCKQTAKDNELTLTISLGDSCNLGCSYCFLSENNPKSSPDISIEKLKTELEVLAARYEKINISLSNGGEPLLYKSRIVELCNMIHNLRDEGISVSLTVVTNGTIYDKEIINKLSDISAIIVFSIDGNKTVHDNCRKYKNGKGTYEDISSTIKSLINDCTLSRVTRNIWSSSVVTAKTDSLVDSIISLKELGCRTVQFKLVKGMNRTIGVNSETLPHYIELYRELFDFLEANIQSNVPDYFMMLLNNGDSMGGLMALLLLEESRYKRCYGATQTIAINGDGTLFPCMFLNNLDDFKIGNSITDVLDAPMYKYFKNIDMFSSEKCTSCWARTICGGECPYHSLIVNNDIFVPDENMCSLTQFIVEHVIHLINILETSNLPMYEKLYSYCKKRRSLE